jgi:hypothetical protein
LTEIAERFDDLEVELWHVKRAIERRARGRRRLNGVIVAAMLDPKQKHRLLMADRTRDAAWITAVVENMLAADPTVTLAEVEAALRDAAAQAYVIGSPGKFSIVIGMPAMLAAVGAAGVTAAEKRAAPGGIVPS